MVVAALKRDPSNPCDDVSAASKAETELPPPSTEPQDVDMNPFPSTAMDESWARGVFDKRRQPSSPAGAAAAAGVAAAPAERGAVSGVAGAFGGSVGDEKHPTVTGVIFDCGPGAGSVTGGSIRSSITSSISSISSNSNSNSVGPVSAGDASAATAAQDQHAGDEAIPLLLVPSALSAHTSSAALGPAEVGDKSSGDDGGGLELLRASELEAAKAAGLLDVVDELLGEAGLEGFGEASSEEGYAPAS